MAKIMRARRKTTSHAMWHTDELWKRKAFNRCHLAPTAAHPLLRGGQHGNRWQSPQQQKIFSMIPPNFAHFDSEGA
jgi:hypothetical protein